jgi:hypothetical protein
LKHLSTEEPIYWPSDRNKLPDLVYFCDTKGIPEDLSVANSCFNRPSDLFAILIILRADGLNQGNESILSNKHTNWVNLRRLINERLTLNIPVETEEDIESATAIQSCPAQRILPGAI